MNNTKYHMSEEKTNEVFGTQGSFSGIEDMRPYYEAEGCHILSTKNEREKAQMDNDSCKKVLVTKETTDKIFGVREVSGRITDMELRYETEDGKEQIYRSQDNRYYLVAEGLGGIGTSTYSLNGRRVCLPVTRATALEWSEWSLGDADYEQALAEFKEPDFNPDFVWKCRHSVNADYPDYIQEYLFKMNDDTYMLLSNRQDYPFCFECSRWVDEESGLVESCVYYMTPETAQRWAVERGMDSGTCESVFGCTSAS